MQIFDKCHEVFILDIFIDATNALEKRQAGINELKYYYRERLR